MGTLVACQFPVVPHLGGWATHDWRGCAKPVVKASRDLLLLAWKASSILCGVTLLTVRVYDRIR